MNEPINSERKIPDKFSEPCSHGFYDWEDCRDGCAREQVATIHTILEESLAEIRRVTAEMHRLQALATKYGSERDEARTALAQALINSEKDS